MGEKISIDVVIPSFRMNPAFIVPILQLPQPVETEMHFILIADQPGMVVPQEIVAAGRNIKLNVLVNTENSGAAASRNRGIDCGNGEWILFLDDDIRPATDLLYKYADAARKNSADTGFIGLIVLPPETGNFTKAILASGAMDIFSIAKSRDRFPWGATANVMINRKALGNIRFSPLFPKSGGGEEVDFFLRLRKQNKLIDLNTLAAAQVEHPWWNNGRPDFKKPFRYGIGNSWLVQIHPEYTYRDWLNTPETFFVLTVLLIIFLFIQFPKFWMLVPVIVAGLFMIEFLATFIQVIKRKPGSGVPTTWYVMLLRFAQESGVLWGKLQRGRPDLIGLRFHDDAKINRFSFYRSNTYRIVKWLLYPILFFFLWKWIQT